ncbi:MAG: threonine--tRNA ligase [Candidatus Micrarchaeota archaeon]|nr:threonine--tRNA ligase [Candidatus Micrarchaeota archaeon]
MLKLRLPDNSTIEVPEGTTAKEAIGTISKRLLSASLAAEVDGKPVDLSYRLLSDCSFKALTFDSKEGKEVFWHSSAHLLAHAVVRLYPQAKPTIGPPIEDGFYYDFADLPPISASELKKIEEEMAKIVQENHTFQRKEITKEEAKALFSGNKFKLELIDEIPEGQHSIYYSGEWYDLCRGPHIPSTGFIKAFKLTKVSSAYWRGDASKDSLQRIYGISFPEKKQLDEYLRMLEEAEKRDHRKLGQELKLFAFHEWSPGSAFFLPKGTIIANELLAFLREQYAKRGYKEVITPQLFNKELWVQSGHWQYYKENMFLLEVDGQEFSLKPMNCPSHCLIYNMEAHSYRDLPLRIADFCMLHRNEVRGALGGLTRVRKLCMDDAHIFCTPQQVGQEIDNMIDFVKFVYHDTFKMEYKAYLSTRPEKYMGSLEQWNLAEAQLEEALKKNKIPYEINPGDGAFYGPKIDFRFKDAIGRSWQLSTIQVDFQMPQRFKCEYEGPDGKMHTCVLLHRAILGSIERFLGVITEHYAGKFPLWLSPVQVALLPVSDRHNEFALSLAQKMKDAGIRAEANCKQETIGAKIRTAQLEKIPFMLVVGDKEVQSGKLAVRHRDGSIRPDVPIDVFIDEVKAQIQRRL